MFLKFSVVLSLMISLSVYAQKDNPADEYVGYQVCGQCHQQEMIKWSGSHHDLAMQEANADTVLGNFDAAEFNYFGLVSKFYRQAGGYWVQTEGADGKLDDFKIKYTFGVYPLQQYLIEFPGGRLQVLDIAWDSRDAQLGGQRWFHLHPKENIEHNDVLHWTDLNLNWNTMCAYCHSTNLQKNYNAETATFKTSWSEINVSCEACHGPGAKHIQWAKEDLKDVKSYPHKGLGIPLNEGNEVRWKINKKTATPSRSVPRKSSREIETCARCHSRRSQLADDEYVDGKPVHQFMEQFRPSLLTEGLYHVDGQIQDEVYVYGSFLQSKMYQAGVTCSDCHDPHIADLKIPGDRVCNQCHLPGSYVTAKHHFHKAGSKGASCIACHMPVNTYMGVDERHDHSFRIPRPELSVRLGTPNACNKCHIDQSPEWAEQQMLEWYGRQPQGMQLFASALSAQRNLPVALQTQTQIQTNASRLLQDLVNNTSQPAIARATAISGLVENADHVTIPILQKQLEDSNPMIRLAAVESLSLLGEREQVSLAFPLLNDPLRSIRMEVARLLTSIEEDQLSEKQRIKLQQARDEYINLQQFNAERPESRVNLGNFYLQLRQYKKAENAYRQALKLQPEFVPAYIDFAQFYSSLNREKDGSEMLQQGQEKVPDNADLYHALGLSLVRQNKLNEAMTALEKAANLAEDNINYHYIYALALNSTGKAKESLTVLDALHERYSNNTDVLFALVTINRDADNLVKALHYLEKLKRLIPDNTGVERLASELEDRSN